MNADKESPNIYDFVDYRDFIESWIELEKKSSAIFSLRWLNQRCGFSSPSYMQSILKGTRSLTVGNLPKICKAFRLKKREEEYLKALIKYDKAKSVEDKNRYFQRIVELKSLKNKKELQDRDSIFLSHWYFLTIYCLLDKGGKYRTIEEIHQSFKTRLTIAEVTEAVELLKKLQFIGVDELGFYVSQKVSLVAQNDLPVSFFNNYHKQILQLAIDSVDITEIHEREYNGVTMRIRSDKLREAKDYLRQMRSQFRAIFDDSEGDVVYQLESILFPLTDKEV